MISICFHAYTFHYLIMNVVPKPIVNNNMYYTEVGKTYGDQRLMT